MHSECRLAVTSHALGLPDMIQYFTLDQNDSFLTRVDATAANAFSSDWMGPVVMETPGGSTVNTVTALVSAPELLLTTSA